MNCFKQQVDEGQLSADKGWAGQATDGSYNQRLVGYRSKWYHLVCKILCLFIFDIYQIPTGFQGVWRRTEHSISNTLNPKTKTWIFFLSFCLGNDKTNDGEQNIQLATPWIPKPKPEYFSYHFVWGMTECLFGVDLSKFLSGKCFIQRNHV